MIAVNNKKSLIKNSIGQKKARISLSLIVPTRVLESSRPLEQMTRPPLSLLFHR